MRDDIAARGERVASSPGCARDGGAFQPGFSWQHTVMQVDPPGQGG
jgi:hypothetical protein